MLCYFGQDWKKELATVTMFKEKEIDGGGAGRANNNKGLQLTSETFPPREDKNNKALEKNQKNGFDELVYSLAGGDVSRYDIINIRMKEIY